MKKLLIFFILASSLPIVGMDTTPDNPVDKESRKRQLDDDKEVSAAKRTKEDQEDEEILAQAEVSDIPKKTSNPDTWFNFDYAVTTTQKKLFKAIKKKDLVGVQKTLRSYPSYDIELPYESRSTQFGSPLQYALTNAHISLPIIQELLNYGANPNMNATTYELSPIIEALDYIKGQTQLDCVKMLLKAKANPNLMCIEEYNSDSGGKRVAPLNRTLHINDRKNVLPLCRLLLEHRANISGQDSPADDEEQNTDITPLLELCYSIESDVHSSDSEEEAIAFMQEYQPQALAELFLNAGADITTKDDKGNSPISVLLPTSTLREDCEICRIDHTKIIRAAHAELLKLLQTHVEQQKKNVHDILTDGSKNYWPSQLTQIVADYWLGNMSPQAIDAPSSSNGSSSTESAPSASLAMPADTILSLDQE